jgi:hypothetical protein
MSAIPMLTKIPEKFGYLFDNMEQEMSLICDQDRAIDELRAAIARYELRIVESKAREKEAALKANALDTKYQELLTQAKIAERELRQEKGVILREHSIQRHMRRMCSVRETRISAREKYLVIDEAKIRLSKIGKELKQNVGRRGGGGFDIYNTNETNT